MKKIIFSMAIIIISSILLGQTTYNVYNGDSIQNVITNYAQDGDRIHVHQYYTGYEGFSFEGKSLEIYSQGSPRPVINGDLSSPSLSVIVDMTNIDNPNEAPPELYGFRIIGSSSAVGVKITNFDGLSSAKIYNNVIDGVSTGIRVENNDKRVEITNNELLNNTIAFYSKESSTNIGFADLFNYNIIYDNDTGLFLGNRSNTSSLECLFYDNDLSIDLTDDIGHAFAYLNLKQSTITNTSSSNTATGIFVSEYDTLNVENCIIYGNNTQIDDDGGAITISYSNIEDGYTGTDNIDEDPYFCMETNYEFHLMEGSPCIDAGNPNTTGGDVRIDMGCYETTTDIKECEGEHWNWVSYPRLYRTNNDSVDVVPLLEDFLDWPFDLQMLYNVILWLNPTLGYNEDNWTPDDYDVISSRGYKLNLDESGSHYLPTLANATRLADDWELTYTLEENDDCWMGYWLPYTQNIEDAFGNFFEHVVSISSEDWYYEFSKEETPSSTTTNKNMVYGKGYIVVFDRDVSDFCWTDATRRSIRNPSNPIPEPQYFSFNDLSSYEAIDVMDIPSDVIEIGVYEDDICVGAVVVQNTNEQILAYTDISNRSQVPLTFEVVTNNRQGLQHVANYRVMNKDTGKYENRSLISGQQRSSVVMFGDFEDPQNNLPGIDQVVLLGNYPNPFNPETNISFSIPQDQKVELIVYNTRGQQVCQLIDDHISSGEHSITWNGKDDNGKNVSSGLYLYKLKTNNQVFSKKMLLLK